MYKYTRTDMIRKQWTSGNMLWCRWYLVLVVHQPQSLSREEELLSHNYLYCLLHVLKTYSTDLCVVSKGWLLNIGYMTLANK